MSHGLRFRGSIEEHTSDQTLHLVLPLNVHVQSALQLVVIQVGTTPRSHDAQFILRRGTVELPVLLVQLPDELDAQVYPMGLEVDEVQPAAIIRRVQLAREINQFGQRSANLSSIGNVSWSVTAPSSSLLGFGISDCGGQITMTECGGGRASSLTSTATWLTTPV